MVKQAQAARNQERWGKRKRLGNGSRARPPPIAVNASSRVSVELHVHIDGAEVRELVKWIGQAERKD